MTKQEVTRIIVVLKSNYRSMFSDIPDDIMPGIVGMWERKLADYTYEEGMEAVSWLIEKQKFAPTISEMLEVLDRIRSQKENFPSVAELWDVFIEALRSAYYEPREMYDSLPPILQKYIATPRALQHLAAASDFTWREQEYRRDFENRVQNLLSEMTYAEKFAALQACKPAMERLAARQGHAMLTGR